jgi:hypothetical protein
MARREGEPEGPDCAITVVDPRYQMARHWDAARFKVFHDQERGVVPCLFVGEDYVIGLDPRVIVFNDSEARVEYSPRAYEDEQLEWVKDWLAQHPHWGVQGCELNWDRAREGVIQ